MSKHRRAAGSGVVVLDVDAWNEVGPDLARLDPSAFRRLLIAARAIVDMHGTRDPDAVAARALPMLDSTDGLFS